MFLVVLRQMRLERLRTCVRILAIAAIVAIVLILEGFLAGFYEQLRAAVMNRGGDLIVTQAGISNFMATRSILPQVARLQVEEVEGVAATHPLTGLSAIYRRDDRLTPILILVYDTAGGPVNIVDGHGITGDREIVIDRSLAARYDLRPGSTMEISGFAFTVAGVSANSSAFMTPFAFVNYDDLIDFYFESDIAEDIATFPLLSLVLVDVRPGEDPAAVAARIEDHVELADVFRPGDLAASDVGLGRDMMGPILGLLLAVSYLIGVLVIGMFTFAAVSGRLRELGVMRALGVRARALGAAVLLEAMLLTLVALPVGVGAAIAISAIIHELGPVYVLLPAEPAAVARTFVASLVFASAGALLPVRAIARIDPSLVFRS